MVDDSAIWQDHQQRINQVLLYLQAHLDVLPTLEELATVASYSPYHFHRLFRAITGESVSRYVRRLRLESAANKLRFTTSDITTIALDAGYETPSAFNKAFKKQFGLAPTQFRETAVDNLQQKIKQMPQMNAQIEPPTIETLPEQPVLYVRKIGSFAESSTAAWQTLMEYAYGHRLMRSTTRRLGLVYDAPDLTDEDKLRYDACITFVGSPCLEGEVSLLTIAGGRYAVFLHKGSYEGFSNTYNAIYGQWLMRSNEQLREAPVFEEYLNHDPRRTKPENLRTLIYIPIL